jgi:hypothetical protein
MAEVRTPTQATLLSTSNATQELRHVEQQEALAQNATESTQTPSLSAATADLVSSVVSKFTPTESTDSQMQTAPAPAASSTSTATNTVPVVVTQHTEAAQSTMPATTVAPVMNGIHGGSTLTNGVKSTDGPAPATVSASPLPVPVQASATAQDGKPQTNGQMAALNDVDDPPLFSPSLISEEVVARLPEGYSIRPLQRSDYYGGKSAHRYPINYPSRTDPCFCRLPLHPPRPDDCWRTHRI